MMQYAKWLERSLASAAVLAVSASLAEADYAEAPQLAELVAQGELPPVAERLPENPLVVTPLERIGTYGGTWNAVLTGSGDKVWLTRTVGYENLVRWNPEWTSVIPNVADSWEVSEDGREYTFNLRKGIRWSDGDLFDTEDIAFAWTDVLTNPELASPPSFLMDGDQPPALEIIDAHTFRLIFTEPKGLLLDHLAHGNADMFTRYPSHYLKPFHKSYAEDIDAKVAEAGVGTWVDLFNQKVSDISPSFGWRNTELPTLFPWRQLTPYDGSSAVVSFERNPWYWKVDPDGNQLPYIDAVRFQVTQDREVTLLKAISGEIDFQWRRINGTKERPILFENAEKAGYNFHARLNANMNTGVFFLNLTNPDPVKREIYRNRDFRIALSHAINRQEIIDTVYAGLGEPYQVAPRPESVYYDEAFAKQYTEHDLEKANALLDGLGYADRDSGGTRLGPDGKPIRIVFEVASGKDFVDLGPLLEQQLAAVGIDLEVREIERSLYETKLTGNELDAGMWDGDGGLGIELDPRWYFPYNFESSFADLWSDWYTAGGLEGEAPPAPAQRQMELFDMVQAEPDLDARRALMRELLEISKEEFWAIGIALPSVAYGITSKRLYNVPAVFPGSFAYPDPAPVNPFTFFYGEPRDIMPYQP
ncbi:ABC transporter substrate-binding protein [Roseobacter sinensis]|uniref:ABC transporter substrate-binding protein n=1 Tax=Roseobacter sinensis TaxID=2931391 RepID=A0ABT3BFE8_9RHOB|nr:ABC transporter substrate-binding protein [Roseobacter sp. WL0113]MCV3272306.1 ABC transporter substrate-binding protein [Roseobacter sp. WL0113]